MRTIAKAVTAPIGGITEFNARLHLYIIYLGRKISCGRKSVEN